MPNVMTALPNIGGALCLTPQSLADAQYWSAAGLVAASTQWAAVARCTRASHVQAQCHDVQLSTWSSAAVLSRLLPTSLWCQVMASSPICWSATARHSFCDRWD